MEENIIYKETKNTRKKKVKTQKNVMAKIKFTKMFLKNLTIRTGTVFTKRRHFFMFF